MFPNAQVKSNFIPTIGASKLFSIAQMNAKFSPTLKRRDAVTQRTGERSLCPTQRGRELVSNAHMKRHFPPMYRCSPTYGEKSGDEQSWRNRRRQGTKSGPLDHVDQEGLQGPEGLVTIGFRKGDRPCGFGQAEHAGRLIQGWQNPYDGRTLVGINLFGVEVGAPGVNQRCSRYWGCLPLRRYSVVRYGTVVPVLHAAPALSRQQVHALASRVYYKVYCTFKASLQRCTSK